MSKKSNAKLSEITAGNLSYIKQWNLTVSDQGTGSDNINFAGQTWEQGSKVSHITIENTGASNTVYIAFDAAGSTITTTNRGTYSLSLDPYYEAELDGDASSVGLRCATGLTTTVKVRAW